jgi:hypothetical protein
MDLSLLQIIGIPIAVVIGLMLSVLDGWVIRRVVKSKVCAIDGASSNTSYLGFLQARWAILMIVSAVCVACFEPVSVVACFASYAIDMRIIAPHRFERRYIVKRIQSVVEDTMRVDPKEATKIARRFYHDTFKKWLKSWSGDERLIIADLILDEYAESQGT